MEKRGSDPFWLVQGAWAEPGVENPSLAGCEHSELTLERFNRCFPKDGSNFSGLVMRTVGDAAAVPDPTGPFSCEQLPTI